MAGDRDDWTVQRGLGGGGQGRAYVVERNDGVVGFLKEMRRPREMRARKRFYREVSAYRTIDHERVPKLLDDNAVAYEDRDIDLFLVTGLIDGVPLDKATAPGGGHALEECLVFALRLLDAVEACHHEGITHRDLKPANVMLRGGELIDPMLVDFGLSFDSAGERDGVTRMGEEVGNRFLRLPEHSAGGGNRRDPRSDLTLLVALLVYCLTGEQSRNLLDEEGRLPHQRDEIREGLLSKNVPPRLLALFDTAFQQEIGRRFQTASGLREALEAVAADAKLPAGEMASDDELLESVLARTENEEARNDAARDQAIRSALAEIGEAYAQLLEELEGRFTYSQSGLGVSGAEGRGRNTVSFVPSGNPEGKVRVKFEVLVVGQELVFSRYGEDEPFYRCSLGDSSFGGQLRANARSVLLKALSEEISK